VPNELCRKRVCEEMIGLNHAIHEAPHVLTWELTRACALHCRHCRAKAIVHRDASELSLAEIERVLDDLEGYEWPPVIVFTGGDPLERPDLDEILQAAGKRQIRTAMAPSVTARLNEETIARWQALGVRSVALSLDGASARVHDGFRGVPGTYQRTMEMAGQVVSHGMRLQINTAVGTYTASELEALGDRVQSLGVSSWEIFFVVPTGRARLSEALSPEQIEERLIWIADYAQTVEFRVTVVAAPQYRRVLERTMPDNKRPSLREGRGFAFIDHQGFVYPSGYLPLKAGNVREEGFRTIYQESPLLTALRDVSLLKGQCAHCEWNRSCGGSRARAYAVTGDVFAADPGCIYAAVGG